MPFILEQKEKNTHIESCSLTFSLIKNKRSSYSLKCLNIGSVEHCDETVQVIFLFFCYLAWKYIKLAEMEYIYNRFILKYIFNCLISYILMNIFLKINLNRIKNII